jgi:hypothetical protein
MTDNAPSIVLREIRDAVKNLGGPPMSTAEGPRKFETEKAAIDAAYQAQLGEQFKLYFFATVGGQRDERDALAKFKAASEALYRAHVHALSVFSDHAL